MGTALALPVLSAGGSIESYIQRVNAVPMLTAEEEKSLALRLQQDNDLEAARQLVLSHLRLVVSVSRKYLGYGTGSPAPDADATTGNQ